MLLNTKNKRFFLKPFWAKFQYYKSLKSDKISKVFGQIFKKKSKFSEKNQNFQMINSKTNINFQKKNQNFQNKSCLEFRNKITKKIFSGIRKKFFFKNQIILFTKLF